MERVNMEPRTDKVNLGISFAGGCGVNNAELITASFDPKEHPHLDFLVMNTDADQLRKFQKSEGYKAWNETHRLYLCQIGYEETKGLGAGGIPDVGRKAVQENISEVEEFLSSLQAHIIVAGMGGGTGGGVAPVIASAAKNKNLSSLAVVTMPFPFEGGARTIKADVALKDIREIVSTIAIYNNNLKERNIDMKAAEKTINESCLEPLLTVLREIIQEVGDCINVDLADWKAVLNQGKYVQFGCYFAENAENSCDSKVVGQELINHQYQDTRIINGANVVLLWFHGAWTVQLIQEVTERVRDDINEEKKLDTEFHLGIHLNVADGKKWVGMIAVADKLPTNQRTEKIATDYKAKPPEARHNKPVVKVELPPDKTDDFVSISFPVLENGGSAVKTIPLRIPLSLSGEWLRIQKDAPYSWRGKEARTKYAEEKARIIGEIEKITGKKLACGNGIQSTVGVIDQPHFLGIRKGGTR